MKDTRHVTQQDLSVIHSNINNQSKSIQELKYDVSWLALKMGLQRNPQVVQDRFVPIPPKRVGFFRRLYCAIRNRKY